MLTDSAARNDPALIALKPVGEQVRAVFFVLLAPSASCNVFKAAKVYS